MSEILVSALVFDERVEPRTDREKEVLTEVGWLSYRMIIETKDDISYVTLDNGDISQEIGSFNSSGLSAEQINDQAITIERNAIAEFVDGFVIPVEEITRTLIRETNVTTR